MLDSGMALDYGKLIMDDEINTSIKHIVKGFEVNSLAFAFTPPFYANVKETFP